MINKSKLELSNLDKVFWPDEGYTKGDVIEYYNVISKLILPYLKNRPESLSRHPNGINGNNFYQKNITYVPEWVKTHIIHSPKERKGKVYLDFLQNSYGQTIVAPYSIRPRPQAPISTPLAWNEVTKKLTPQQFTIKNIFKRLEKIGDIWQPVLGKGVNLNKCLASLSNYLDLDQKNLQDYTQSE